MNNEPHAESRESLTFHDDGSGEGGVLHRNAIRNFMRIPKGIRISNLHKSVMDLRPSSNAFASSLAICETQSSMCEMRDCSYDGVLEHIHDDSVGKQIFAPEEMKSFSLFNVYVCKSKQKPKRIETKRGNSKKW